MACRYKDVLNIAASQVVKLCGSGHGALVLNLGPAWLSPEAYGLFNNTVIEIPFKDWESPPGLGICPLGVIFTVCSSIASWLALNEDHVVVSLASCLPFACHIQPSPPSAQICAALSVADYHTGRAERTCAHRQKLGECLLADHQR